MDVNQAIVKTLEDIGVGHVFGGSGQVNASMLLALRDSDKIETVIVRNEQAASFMACGYTMFNPSNIGVCFATGGPGAFNLFSGLAVAYYDSLPVIAITGYTSMSQRGKGALNESTGLNRTPDSHAMFSATTKKSYILEDPSQACDILEDAINTALEGRPGPVHIHIPKDITTAEVPNFRKVNVNVKRVLPSAEKIASAAGLLTQALKDKKKIMAIVGYGCIRSRAARPLLELIDTYRIPFTQTMDAKGLLSESHPLCLGVYGTSGDKAAGEWFDSADVVITLGNSFAQNACFAFKPDLFEGKKLIHINIDPAEIDKVYKADVGIVSDAAPAVEALLKALEKAGARQYVNEPVCLPKEKFYLEAPHPVTGRMHPGDMVRALSDNLPDNAIVMGDAGSHMLWLSGYLQLGRNQRYQNPGSFGPMASHTNGSIGVKCANPDKVVVAGVGDGCYQMAGFELMTAVQYNIPVIWIIFNNGEFNIIKKFMLGMYGQEAYMQFDNPDFVKYAESCGAKGWRVSTVEEFTDAFNEAVALNKPCIIDCIVDNSIYPPFKLGKV
ncbi:MAG: thiamine pyrophosphate-binding protein [Bacteroidales bacterium]|nr:thiamine pyrophosphate-binding protein [Bacteroidales bacterium]